MVTQTDPAADGAKNNLMSAMQSKLAEGLMGVFELVIADRKDHFAKHPDRIPDRKSAPSIISSYCTANAAISGGASLIPGPWGMVAVVPEITAVVRNQLAMIYDVGMAYGKREVLSKELLAGVLITAMGASAGSLLVMQGEKVLVKRVALRGFQRVIELLAGRVTQQVLKSTISKWLPVVGAAAMAAWSNYLTRRVGRMAVEIFEKEVVLSDDVIDEVLVQAEPEAQMRTSPTGCASPSSTSLVMSKVQALINLMRVDGMVRKEEREYVQTIIANSGLTEGEVHELEQAWQTGRTLEVDYSSFACSPDEAIGLLVDLVALAGRDGTLHVTEMMFVRQVGKILGFLDADVDELLVPAC